MNNIPLPNELVRKIYQFINPIFDYVKYIYALKQHREERFCFLEICESSWNYNELLERINANDMISTYALLMNDRLVEINNFIIKNPSFRREYSHINLQYWQHKIAWQYEYTDNNITDIDNQILSRYNYFHNNINCKLISFLKKANQYDLIQSCIENGIILEKNIASYTKKELIKKLTNL